MLADENMDADIIAWLRGAGVDVLSVMETLRGASDEVILARANAESRVILTKDMDFGEMIFFDGLPAVGVILLRIHDLRSVERLELVRLRWEEIAEHAAGNFLVVTKQRIRVRPLPPLGRAQI
ncbi:MAG TPA: DUF5615 family PIN-like protein [Phycisphaerae bacterium]|jgi:predicted nuclease of predicted toxin-antitoxin system|nr:DUF5615 family PIN-like protein [Phycisphaerae bacterium]